MNFLDDILGEGADELKTHFGGVVEDLNSAGQFEDTVNNSLDTLGEWQNLGQDQLAQLSQVASNFGLQSVAEIAQNLPQDAMEKLQSFINQDNWGAVQDLMEKFFNRNI